MVSLQKESELENLPWQFRFEKLYRKLHGLPDNDPLLTGHCQTFIKAFEQILHEEISNREKEIAEEVPNALHEYARWILTDGKNAGPLQRRGKKKEITLQILKH